MIESILDVLGALTPLWLYVALGLGAAVENLVPPVPADTFVLFGAFLAAQGRATVWGVFLSTWTLNVGGSFSVYLLARKYGRAFFGTRTGRFLLRPRQLQTLERLYAAHGPKIIFFSRFVPGFRALVPVFAGVAHLRGRRSLLPIAVASALWYGALIALGTLLGKNWDLILRALASVNRVLALAALVLGLVVAWAWWRSRRLRVRSGEPGGEPGGRREPEEI